MKKSDKLMIVANVFFGYAIALLFVLAIIIIK